jgi:adenylate cyclase
VPEPLERKLTTILCADVKGYSQLMDVDEVDTLETLRAYRQAISGFIERHHGRLVNTWGDAVLVEFASVVEAVQCAVEIQRELAARNAALAEDRRMEFRIGINLGDVMVEDGDLYGEGVNVAARLQSLADAGGITISGTVFDQVKHKLTIAFEYLGEQSVKNIEEPVPTYKVELHPEARSREAPSPERPRSGTIFQHSGAETKRPSTISRLQRALIAVAVLTAFLLAVNLMSDPSVLWFFWPAIAAAFAMSLWLLAAAPGFRSRAAASVAIVGLLFLIDLITTPDVWWFQWPALVIAFLWAMLALKRYGGRSDGQGRAEP